MRTIKNQLLLLLVVDLLIILLFLLRTFNIIAPGLFYGVLGIILDISVVALSVYIIKDNRPYLQEDGHALYKYFVYVSSLLIFLP